MSQKDSAELIGLDLTQGASESVVIDEFKKLGKVQIVDIKYHDKGDWRADVTGQKGKFEFDVQGENQIYKLGADLVMKLTKAIGASTPVMTKDVAVKLQSSKHFSKLRQANTRQ